MSSNSNELGNLGLDEPVLQQIRTYYPDYPESTIQQMLSDPEIVLLSILVDELGSRQSATSTSSDGPERQTAQYYAEQYTVTSDGPRIDGESPENVEGQRIDIGFSAGSWDLRFDDDIVVSWKEPNRTNREVNYRSQDSPVVGISRQSRYLWVKRADSASSDATLFVEGDIDG